MQDSNHYILMNHREYTGQCKIQIITFWWSIGSTQGNARFKSLHFDDSSGVHRSIQDSNNYILMIHRVYTGQCKIQIITFWWSIGSTQGNARFKSLHFDDSSGVHRSIQDSNNYILMIHRVYTGQCKSQIITFWWFIGCTQGNARFKSLHFDDSSVVHRAMQDSNNYILMIHREYTGQCKIQIITFWWFIGSTQGNARFKSLHFDDSSVVHRAIQDSNHYILMNHREYTGQCKIQIITFWWSIGSTQGNARFKSLHFDESSGVHRAMQDSNHYILMIHREYTGQCKIQIITFWWFIGRTQGNARFKSLHFDDSSGVHRAMQDSNNYILMIHREYTGQCKIQIITFWCFIGSTQGNARFK